jgi:hypothetical protein
LRGREEEGKEEMKVGEGGAKERKGKGQTETEARDGDANWDRSVRLKALYQPLSNQISHCPGSPELSGAHGWLAAVAGVWW